MQDFTKLRVWHLAHDIALKVVEALPPGSARAVPGLRTQAVRAATSVPANIAEGCTRESRQEFLHFVQIAFGSHNELSAHLRLARDARIISPSAYALICDELEVQRRMLVSLMRTLQQRIAEAEHSRRESDRIGSE